MKKIIALGCILALCNILWSLAIIIEDGGKECAIQSKAKYNVVLVIDGPRFSETFGDSTYQYIPNLGKVLKPQGTLLFNFRNEGPTYTISGHTALCTGVHQKISNSGTKLPKYPSIFQYLIKQKELEKDRVWILGSKGKLEVLANTKDKDWWNQYQPMTYCGIKGTGIGYAKAHDCFPKFKEIVLEEKPVLTLINLLDVDVWGHGKNKERYLQSIKELDSLALDLWNNIQTDPEMKNNTNFFITNDHGRHLDGHKDGYISHGDGCEGCRHISLLAIGPDFAPDTVIYKEYDQIDFTATLAALLNIQMPTAKGRIINEMLKRDVFKSHR